jgi:hypothetical protein
MEYLSNQTIAKLIEDKLNDYSDLLFSNELITEQIRFRITDDFQKYTSKTKYEGLKYTPGVLQLTAPRMPEYAFAGILAEDYVITFYGVIRQRDDIQKILNYYVRVQNDERSFTYCGWTITNTIQKPRFIETVDHNEGKKEDSFILQLVLNWSYVLGGVVGRDSNIKIDNVLMDYYSIAYRNDKSLLPNITYGTHSNDKLVSEQVVINFPIQQGNTKNVELLASIMNSSYNKTHTVQFTVGSVVKTITGVIRSGTLSYNNDNTIVGFIITFQKALPRIPIYIDDQTVLVGAFSVDMEKGIEIIPQVGVGKLSINATAVKIGRSISMTVILDGSTKANELAKDIANDDFMKKQYVIRHSIGGVEYTFSMFMQKGHYRYTENANLTLECIFAGAA